MNKRGGDGLSGRPRGHIWGYKYVGNEQGYRNTFLAVFFRAKERAERAL